MRAHNLAVLEQAEKKLRAKQRNHALGLEIEELKNKVCIIPKEWQYVFNQLYNFAKRDNPEIWESNAYTLPYEAFKNNEDFFELLGDICDLDFLMDLYPENRKTLKAHFRDEFFIGRLTSYLRWYLKYNDKLPPFSKLLVDAKIKKGNEKEA